MKANLFILSILLVVVFTSCEKESLLEKGNKAPSQFTTIESDPKLSTIKGRLETYMLNSNSRVENIFLDNLNWDRVYKAGNSIDEEITYTVPVINDYKLNNEFLVINDKYGSYYGYILKLEPDLEWLNYNQVFNEFSGYVKIIDLEGTVLIKSRYENGKRVRGSNSNGRTSQCETWIDVVWTEVCIEGNCTITEMEITEYEVCVESGGGGGGGSIGTPIGTGEGGDGDGGSSGSGGSGGESGPIGFDGIPDCGEGYVYSAEGDCVISPNQLCGTYNFTQTGSGLTAQIERLQAYGIHTSTNETVTFFHGAVCITFGNASGATDNIIASRIMKEAWNLAMDDTELWLNSLPSKPTSVAFSNEIFKYWNEHLDLLALGSYSLSGGPCLGTVSSNVARYQCGLFGN